MKTSKPLKAYSVQTDDAGVIVFANSTVGARRLGSNELNTELEYINSCCRAAWADSYALQGWVPAEVLIQQGWWLECSFCGDCVEDESWNHKGVLHEPVFEGSKLYCSPGCKDAELIDKQKREKRKHERITVAQEKWPGITILYVSDHIEDALVHFKFPGSKGVVVWQVGSDTARINRDDIPSWESFVSNHDEIDNDLTNSTSS